MSITARFICFDVQNLADGGRVARLNPVQDDPAATADLSAGRPSGSLALRLDAGKPGLSLLTAGALFDVELRPVVASAPVAG